MGPQDVALRSIRTGGAPRCATNRRSPPLNDMRRSGAAGDCTIDNGSRLILHVRTESKQALTAT